MSLLSITNFLDVILSLFLLVPGFIALMIIKKIGIVDRKLSDYETIIFSLFISSVILISFGRYLQLETFEDIYTLLIKFSFLINSNIWGIIIGLLVGVFLR